MKFYFAIIIIILPLLFLQAQSSVEKAKGQSGIELLLKNYDWDNLWSEITITPKITICKHPNMDEGLFSPFVATLSEPLYLAGVSIKKGEIKAFNMNIFSDPSKTGNGRDDGGVYVNIIRIPLLNMLLGKSTKGALAFEKGYIRPVYIGVFDPKKWDNIMAMDLIPERTIFANVRAQLASVISCVAYTGIDAMSPSAKRRSSTALRLRDIVDSFYFSVGCLGPIPTGTSTVHHDPISNGILAISSVLYDMYGRRGVVAELFAKHTTRNVLNSYSKKVLCEPILNPIFPQSAFSAQLLFPTISKTHELGVSPAQYNFHGAAQSGKNIFFIINQRRDYAAFAYQD